MTVAPETIRRFRRNDLIATLEGVPQQARPVGIARMDKTQLQGEVLRIAAALPEVAKMVARMAEDRA